MHYHPIVLARICGKTPFCTYCEARKGCPIRHKFYENVQDSLIQTQLMALQIYSKLGIDEETIGKSNLEFVHFFTSKIQEEKRLHKTFVSD